MIKTFQNNLNISQDAANPKRIRGPGQHFSIGFPTSVSQYKKSGNHVLWPSTRLYSQRYYLHFRFIIVFHGTDMK